MTTPTCFLCADPHVAGFAAFVPTNDRCRRAVRTLTGDDAFPYWFCLQHVPTKATAERVEALVLAMAEGGES